VLEAGQRVGHQHVRRGGIGRQPGYETVWIRWRILHHHPGLTHEIGAVDQAAYKDALPLEDA
jgi:hypothetical protein